MCSTAVQPWVNALSRVGRGLDHYNLRDSATLIRKIELNMDNNSNNININILSNFKPARGAGRKAQLPWDYPFQDLLPTSESNMY